jgi:hypothetical protein
MVAAMSFLLPNEPWLSAFGDLSVALRADHPAAGSSQNQLGPQSQWRGSIFQDQALRPKAAIIRFIRAIA